MPTRSVDEVSRDAWRVLFNALEAVKGTVENMPFEDRRTWYLRKSYKVPDIATLSEYDNIVASTGATLVRATWFYNYHPIIEMEHRWHSSSPVLTLSSNGNRDEMTRKRLNAALRLTNGWEIYARKERGRTVWYVSSRYAPFPRSKKGLTEAIGKGHIKEFNDDDTFYATL